MNDAQVHKLLAIGLTSFEDFGDLHKISDAPVYPLWKQIQAGRFHAVHGSFTVRVGSPPLYAIVFFRALVTDFVAPEGAVIWDPPVAQSLN
jgi:hypothetical protein